MSIFGSIMSSLFGGGATPSNTTDTSSTTASTETASADTASTDTTPTDDQSQTQTSAPTAASAPATPQQPFDVAAMLSQRAAQKGEQLNWQTSIVDLLKLLDLPSDLETRLDLSHELAYTGSTEDTAKMNTWLHREVMTKLADRGGIVPDEWKHPD